MAYKLWRELFEAYKARLDGASIRAGVWVSAHTIRCVCHMPATSRVATINRVTLLMPQIFLSCSPSIFDCLSLEAEARSPVSLLSLHSAFHHHENKARAV